MRFFLALALLMMTSLSQAAPHPATGSSLLTDPAKGVFFHGFGFKLKAIAADWAPTPVLSESVFESLRFESLHKTQGKDASISLHLERMSKVSPLETYARKWMKEYSSYGFEVLGTKSVLLNGDKALLVDLTQNKKNRQLRQAILQNEDRVVVVTCIDRKDLFQQTLAVCNDFLRGFEWVSEKSPTLIQDPASKSL
ncbi:MAG: hypothetical protein KF789_07695 [Bdellovibrionaceae bacterium]|nr:hypothetical protein [Pseudobdellovibrionaceae bacterium]